MGPFRSTRSALSIEPADAAFGSLRQILDWMMPDVGAPSSDWSWFSRHTRLEMLSAQQVAATVSAMNVVGRPELHKQAFDPEGKLVIRLREGLVGFVNLCGEPMICGVHKADKGAHTLLGYLDAVHRDQLIASWTLSRGVRFQAPRLARDLRYGKVVPAIRAPFDKIQCLQWLEVIIKGSGDGWGLLIGSPPQERQLTKFCDTVGLTRCLMGEPNWKATEETRFSLPALLSEIKRAAILTMNRWLKRADRVAPPVVVNPIPNLEFKEHAYLKLAPSQIPDGGVGVVAIRPLPKDKYLGEFTGCGLTEHEYQSRKGPAIYVYKFDFPAEDGVMYLDSTHSNCMQKYINCCAKDQPPNVVVVQDHRHRLVVYALRAIGVGEELLSDYGNEFHWAESPQVEKRTLAKIVTVEPTSEVTELGSRRGVKWELVIDEDDEVVDAEEQPLPV